MYYPIFWAVTGIAGMFGAGWALQQGEGALDAGARLAKWSAVAGGVYLTYSAAKSAGMIK